MVLTLLAVLIAFPLHVIALCLGVFFLFTRRWLGVFWMALALVGLEVPSMLTRADLAARGADARMVLNDGEILISDNGPIAFTLQPRPNPYTDNPNYFITTQLSDGTEISISFSAVGRGQPRTMPEDCVIREGPYGLIERPRGENEGFCRTVRRTPDYGWTDRPSQFSRIYCLRDNETYCVLGFIHNTMQISVATWEADLSRWREVRDHVTALLDQSFAPVAN